MAATREDPETEPVGLAVYLRVSSDEQKRAHTIETQRAVLQRYLAAQGLTAGGWYEDEAWSGYFVPFAKRPDGARLMADVRAGAVSAVIVTKLDRFGRNAREILNAVHELEQAGARLVSLKENVDTRTSAGRFFLTVLAGVAELERDMIMERSGEGTTRRKQSGGWLGGPTPYGYVVEGKGDGARLIPDTRPFSDLPELNAADVVILIYRLLVEERQSTQQVADHLNALGVPTAYRVRGLTRIRQGVSVPVAGIWRAQRVWALVRNPTYMGVFAYGYLADRQTATAQAVEGTHPALVAPALWHQAQAAFQTHKALSRRNAHREYLLRGLLRCAPHCGCVYGGSWHKSGDSGDPERGHRAYICNGKKHARRAGALPKPRPAVARVWPFPPIGSNGTFGPTTWRPLSALLAPSLSSSRRAWVAQPTNKRHCGMTSPVSSNRLTASKRKRTR